ncbi:hypothetical protein O6H91_14G061300 [Diphasiastrum complanatum]|uniref:Uncharacterized protein n=1 Tax=Diphasiastrum complanatum TaxID=34168 RepID=A0ACC2BQ97_DIPCM|nr:hypothetical protein O6H91_14G061300 [Diphasiastrum complanatum]
MAMAVAASSGMANAIAIATSTSASSFFLKRSCCMPQQQPRKTFSLNIRCARVGGIEIPNSKRIEISLQYIHGVGKTTARQILLDAGMENRHTRELTEEDLTRLRDEVSKYMIEGDLRTAHKVQRTHTERQEENYSGWKEEGTKGLI